jgi:hypothetical protein
MEFSWSIENPVLRRRCVPQYAFLEAEDSSAHFIFKDGKFVSDAKYINVNHFHGWIYGLDVATQKTEIIHFGRNFKLSMQSGAFDEETPTAESTPPEFPSIPHSPGEQKTPMHPFVSVCRICREQLSSAGEIYAWANHKKSMLPRTIPIGSVWWEQAFLIACYLTSIGADRFTENAILYPHVLAVALQVHLLQCDRSAHSFNGLAIQKSKLSRVNFRPPRARRLFDDGVLRPSHAALELMIAHRDLELACAQEDASPILRACANRLLTRYICVATQNHLVRLVPKLFLKQAMKWPVDLRWKTWPGGRVRLPVLTIDPSRLTHPVWQTASLTPQQRRRMDFAALSAPVTMQQALLEEQDSPDEPDDFKRPPVPSDIFEGFTVSAARDDYDSLIFPSLRPHNTESAWQVITCERLRTMDMTRMQFMDQIGLVESKHQDTRWASGVFQTLFGVNEVRFDHPVGDRQFADWHAGIGVTEDLKCVPLETTESKAAKFDTSVISLPFGNQTNDFKVANGGVAVLGRWDEAQVDLFMRECKTRKLQAEEAGTALPGLRCFWVIAIH